MRAISFSFCLLLSAACLGVPAQPSAVFQRVPNTTLNMPQVPQSFGFKTEKAFGNLAFNSPVGIRTPPGETNRLFIVEQGGKIFVITNLVAPDKTLFLDLSKQVRVGDIEGLFAMAFHPGYGTNGFFFVAYNLTTQTGAGSGAHYRVSRLTVSTDDPNLASTNSELPLITQRYSGSGICDDLLFGPDGYLYIAVADPNADAGGTTQAIDTNLYGGILRIDVDKKPGSLAPNAHPAVTTNYAIPSDNPFIGTTGFNGAAVDPAKVRTEFYAIGLRNPWRIWFDDVSGLLYAGDPGGNQRDEIDIILKGANYGWPYREGTLAGPKAKQAPPGFVSIDPIYQYSNPSAVIGGAVYRGQRYPALQGAFIFGDWSKGDISALRPAGTNPVPVQKLTTEAGVVAFGLDPANGDLLFVNRTENRIKRLIYSTNMVGAPLPASLAETGAFADLATLTPPAGIVPYDLNVPFWSDNARKTRWFAVPNVTKTIGFSRDGNWSFPPGTVWIKHFELELTNGVPESARRLETRLIVRTTNGVYGVTYRWGDSLTNAVLVPEEGLDETFTIHDAGTVRTQVWHYPSRSECLTCHTPIAGHALGFKTAQLNRDFGYSGSTQNQIQALSDAGYFSTNIPGFHTLPALTLPTNEAVSLDFRVRSYLAVNCVQCHQPGGTARGGFDTRLSTPLSLAGLVNGVLVDTLGSSDNRVIKPGSLDHSVLLTRVASLGPGHMPPLATSVVNSQAVELLSAWITNGLAQYQSFSDWQLANFGSIDAPDAAPDSDPDGDGAANELEYLTGTNPLIAGDGWGLRIAVAGAQAEILVPRIANRGFELQWTTDVSDPASWRPLEAPGNEPVFALTNSAAKVQDTLTNAPGKFYRVRILEP